MGSNPVNVERVIEPSAVGSVGKVPPVPRNNTNQYGGFVQQQAPFQPMVPPSMPMQQMPMQQMPMQQMPMQQMPMQQQQQQVPMPQQYGGFGMQMPFCQPVQGQQYANNMQQGRFM